MENYNLPKQLADMYLDFFNNYLTVAKFAEHRQITDGEAITLLDMGRKYHNQFVDNHVEVKN